MKNVKRGELKREKSFYEGKNKSPLIPHNRNRNHNVITIITPVIEVDGREKQVDTYYFNKKRLEGEARLPLMYWGKYVAHDNNRDGMGQFLALTRHVTKVQNEWKPTVMHDLHEAQTYLYASTGTGPYNEALDPITFVGVAGAMVLVGLLAAWVPAWRASRVDPVEAIRGE